MAKYSGKDSWVGDRRSQRMFGDLAPKLNFQWAEDNGIQEIEWRHNFDGTTEMRYVDRDGLKTDWFPAVISDDMKGDGMANINRISADEMAGSMRNPWQRPIEDLSDRLDSTIKFYNGWLEEVGLGRIDEVAVMFNSDEEKYGWLKGAVAEPGVRIFNHAVDNVNTSPLPSNYSVEYTFLEHEDLDWRVEAMHITSGHSPLHDALRRNRIGGSHIVHLSFKCHSVREWLKAVETLNKEAELAQMCASTYGRFGYWIVPEEQLHRAEPLYIKPRVNERDA